MKFEKVVLFVVAAGAAISISNAQTTTSTTTGAKVTTTTTAAAKPMAKTEAKPAAPAPATPAELRQLDYFVGAWQCNGKNMGMSEEKATSARVDVAWDLAGNWLATHYNETMTAANQHPVSGQEHEGWDANQKKFVSLWTDNMGGYQMENSTGWDGDKMVWEGPLHFGADDPVNGRDTFTKKSATEMTHMGELNLKGTWTMTDQEDCKKIKATTKSTKKTK